MGIDALKSQIPDTGKDVRVNLGRVLSTEGIPDLTADQQFGVALSCAYATRNKDLVNAILEEVQIDESIIKAAQSAAIIMGMNNIYYRFTHLVGDEEFQSMPASLRMQVIGNPGIEKADFELYCLAISAINGCGQCMASHAHHVQELGISKLGIQSAIRIASVLNATVQALSI